MFTAILLLAYRQLQQKNPALAGRVLDYAKKSGRILLIIVLFLLISQLVFPQSQKLEYAVKRKGDSIGIIVLEKNYTGTNYRIKMQSEINIHLLLSFKIDAREEGHFENNILIRSSAVRHLNGRQQVNNSTMLNGSGYKIIKENKVSELKHYPIQFNMLRLYFEEPVSISKVYSDNFQQIVSITKTGAGRYRVQTPDGAVNEYYYSNGTCIKIIHQQKLYTTTIELVRKA